MGHKSRQLGRIGQSRPIGNTCDKLSLLGRWCICLHKDVEPVDGGGEHERSEVSFVGGACSRLRLPQDGGVLTSMPTVLLQADGNVNVAWIQQYVSMILLGTSSFVIQSMGSPKCCLLATKAAQPNNSMAVTR